MNEVNKIVDQLLEQSLGKSQEYDWKHEEEEVFTFLCREWDVRKAKELIKTKPHKVQRVDVSSLRGLVTRPVWKTDKEGRRYTKHTVGVGINWDMIDKEGEKVDLSVPLILVTLRKKKGGRGAVHFPIDGWHRIAKALE